MLIVNRHICSNFQEAKPYHIVPKCHENCAVKSDKKVKGIVRYSVITAIKKSSDSKWEVSNEYKRVCKESWT